MRILTIFIFFIAGVFHVSPQIILCWWWFLGKFSNQPFQIALHFPALRTLLLECLSACFLGLWINIMYIIFIYRSTCSASSMGVIQFSLYWYLSRDFISLWFYGSFMQVASNTCRVCITACSNCGYSQIHNDCWICLTTWCIHIIHVELDL